MTLLAKILHSKSYTIEFFTYHSDDFFKHRLDALDIPVNSVLKTSKTGFKVVLKLRKLLKAKSFDVIISFLQTPSFYAAVSKVLAGNHTPLIISERFISFEKKGTVKHRIKKITHSLANFATTNSHHEKNRLISKGLAKSDKIKTIYNVVDLDHFKPSTMTKMHKRFLCVASVSSYKNGLCVIEAMHILKQTGALDFGVTWIGNKVYTIKERADYINKMESKIKEYDLAKYWQWIDPTKDILSYYHTHDALIHASYREGLPNVVCESLACGLPVILSEVLDHPFLADIPNNGFLFNPDKPVELSERIRSFYDLSQSEKKDMQTNCRNYAEENFSEDRFVAAYETIINAVTNA